MEPKTPLQKRLEVQEFLQQISGLPESKVHFQPPNGTKMDYTGDGAIVYSRDREVKQFADNLPYHVRQSYTVTVIHLDPDNEIKDKVAALPYCSFDRWYATDGLNHDVYTLFY